MKTLINSIAQSNLDPKRFDLFLNVFVRVPAPSRKVGRKR